MMFTSRMRLLAAVAFSADADAIAGALLRVGAMEAISIHELSGEWTARLSGEAPGPDRTRLPDLRKRIEGFMNMAEPPIRPPVLGDTQVQPADPRFLGKAEVQLDSLAGAVKNLRDQQKLHQDEILKLEEMQRQLGSVGDPRAIIAGGEAHSFLSVNTGLLAANQLDELSGRLTGIPSLLLPAERKSVAGGTGDLPLVLVCMKRDAARVQSILSGLGWTETPTPAFSGNKAEALQQIQQKIQVCRANQQDCAVKLRQFLAGERDSMERLWATLRTEELLDCVKTGFGHTEHTVLFCGWIPSDRATVTEQAIRSAASKGCSVEWLEPGQGEAAALTAPVELRNPETLRPFEGLVRNYAIPEYGSVDPTPFVATAYLLMFGLMFGDAGHGLVVALVGLLGILRARRNGGPDGLFRIMSYCGCSAIFFGVLFGSYFGLRLFPALWFDYHGVVSGEHLSGSIGSVYGILGLTIKFGIVVLGTGFAINWVNRLRKKDWFNLFLDKGGLLGGWIYGAGTWVAFYFVEHQYKALPGTAILLPLLGIPTLLLALKPPLEYFHHGKRKLTPGAMAGFLMEWIVEILEVYSGYLSNTLSFMRVAGLGIAHVSLMTAFFQIARMINPQGGFSLPALLVLVLGNALVIALEGLSAGIQSLRLNYYEFFSRYFNGSGRAYRPVSFDSND